MKHPHIIGRGGGVKDIEDKKIGHFSPKHAIQILSNNYPRLD